MELRVLKILTLRVSWLFRGLTPFIFSWSLGHHHLVNELHPNPSYSGKPIEAMPCKTEWTFWHQTQLEYANTLTTYKITKRKRYAYNLLHRWEKDINVQYLHSFSCQSTFALFLLSLYRISPILFRHTKGETRGINFC